MEVATITKAVRSVLTASTLALAISPVAWAGDCTAPAPGTAIQCDGAFTDAVAYSGEDLTLIVGANTPTNVTVTNVGAAVSAFALNSVDVTVAAEISAYSDVGDAFGVYAYAIEGDTTVVNTGPISAVSEFGLADGIFASGGQNVTVDNGGDVSVSGYTWAAGIEAGSDDGSVAVNNGGAIDVALSGDVYAPGNYASATGIFAKGSAGAQVTTSDSSSIAISNAVNGIGISATSYGDTSVTNAGTVNIGQGSLYATGIHAVVSAEAGSASVDNSGAIEAVGSFSATGIEVLASGVGAVGSLTNSAGITAVSNSAATGLFVSADGGATLDNSGDTLAIAYGAGRNGGVAYGLQATSLGGDTSVENTAAVTSYATGKYYASSTGISSSSQYGTASLTNTGDVQALNGGLLGATAFGLRAVGGGASVVDNSGDITASGKYTYGILATSSAGDVSVTNSGSITLDRSFGYNQSAFGLLTVANLGDTSVANSGLISVTGGSAYGVVFQAGADANADNSGSISVSGDGIALGIFGLSRTQGDVTLTNSGDITTDASAGSAYGIFTQTRSATEGSPNTGNVSIEHTGTIAVSALGGNATGISASAIAGDVSISSSGGIDAQALAYINGNGVYAGDAFGIYAVADEVDGTISVTNTGQISAVSEYGLADGIFASGQNVTVNNSGTIGASGYTWAAGIEAGSDYGSVAVANDGAIDVALSSDVYASGNYAHASGISALGGMAAQVTTTDASSIAIHNAVYGTGISAVSYGNTNVSNGGSITIGDGSLYATGIHAAASAEGGTATVDNSGTIDAVGSFGATGIEVLASGVGATGHVTNVGDIAAVSYQAATGVFASADGGAVIDNSGTVLATGLGTGVYGGVTYGLQATSLAGDTSVNNAGSVTAYSTGGKYYGTSTGISSSAQYGTASITNSGDVNSFNTSTLGATTTGLRAAGGGGTAVDNSGNITASGKYTYGIMATSAASDVSVSNSGSITLDTSYGSNKYGFGLLTVASAGDTSVTNSGQISVEGGSAYGVVFQAGGNATASNSGSIAVSGDSIALGMFGLSRTQGNVSLTNSGDITAYSYAGSAYGIFAQTRSSDATLPNNGSISITNAGSIAATAYGDATGISAGAMTGNVSIGGNGSIEAHALSYVGYDGGTYGGNAYGVFAQATGGNVSVGTGTISAISDAGFATGALALSTQGNVAITNSGDVSASVAGLDGTRAVQAIGLYGLAPSGAVSITNSGTAQAFAPTGLASGVVVYGNTFAVTNSGTISAEGASSVGVTLEGTAGSLTNAGTIKATTPTGDGLAILGLAGDLQITNSGVLSGGIVTGSGADTLDNSGSWEITGTLNDFGAGNDRITNTASGKLVFADGTLSLGSGSNTFENRGTIVVSGDNVIDMGTGPDATPDLLFTSLTPRAAAVVSANGQPFLNNGIIDFVDGAPDDVLTINGDLGGSGTLNLDISTLQGLSDKLYVNGNVVDGTKQQVDATLVDGAASSRVLSAPPVQFAVVTGSAASNAFVGGIVANAPAGGFLSLGVLVSSQATAAGATAFSAQVAANGLNDTGVLAASIAPGVQNLLTSQIGTWRQRMGVVPPTSGESGFSTFARVFRDSGDVSPSHEAVNFGQDGGFDFEQTNSGTEVGVNMALTERFNIGVTLAKAKGSQHLSNGVGLDRIDGDTLGAYASWMAPSGFYLDASYRLMYFDTKLQSAAGIQRSSDGNASAVNLEGGYAFNLGNGLTIEPQLQYTWTSVDSVSIQGEGTMFRSQDADWQRGRVGVLVSKAFQTGGDVTWTPYGAASAVHVGDGASGYTIDNAFLGNTSTKGNSALVELGIGMRAKGFSATAGANWSDGGSLDGFFGGQVVVRYDW
jgi:hypothetical protein